MTQTLIDSIANNVLEIIIALISCVVSYYVIPYIKSDLIPWLKEKRIYGMIEKFVRGVEKMAEAGVIEKVNKKEVVIELLKDKGIEITDAIEVTIESAVKELDLIGKTVKEEILTNEESK